MLSIGTDESVLQVLRIVRSLAPAVSNITGTCNLSEFRREILGLVEDMSELMVDCLDILMVQGISSHIQDIIEVVDA